MFRIIVVLMAVLTAHLGACAQTGVAAESRLPKAPPGQADPAFQAWLAAFRVEALSQGVSARTFDGAMRGVVPDVQVVTANNNQPEFVRPVWDYLSSAISDTRVVNGRNMLSQHRATLARLEETYGVDRHVLVAIWGLESGYGAFMGTHRVTQALATLAYSGRRTAFGREQLLAALKILERGDIPADQMTGSWAGAMGHTQFIPTTFNAFAVDADGDGKRDIWHSIPDALGSAGNYLGQSGWEKGGSWGQEVKLPDGFNYALADMSLSKAHSDWAALGVKGIKGEALNEGRSTLLLPAGYMGPAFLVQQNFRTVLRYNNATSYSLAVNLLADELRGRRGVVAAWPEDEQPLNAAARQEMQRLLTEKGYDTKGVDGIIGANTRDALRAWQVSVGLPADGYPTSGVLARLRR